MARPTKFRKVCRIPGTLGFQPAEPPEKEEPVILTVDEFETIRLIDKEGLSQDQCSQRMEVARTTTQKIYESARRKLAEALVEGRSLRIEGGAFRLCDGSSQNCGQRQCLRKQLLSQFHCRKGYDIMRIAVTYENGEIFQHFGHTEFFKLYDVQEGKILSSQVVSTNGSGHGALAELLLTMQVDALICGGIGGGAQMALASAGIQLFGGVSGDADAAVEAFLAGQLSYNPNVQCSHHGEHHHEGSCGSHSCGNH